MWNPDRYARYAEDRAQPFHDLLAAVPAEAPGYVADVGCGSGELTARLARRWPTARVEGVDNSPQMLAAAAGHEGGTLSFTAADAATWQPTEAVDVLVSNACLQWVDGHADVLRRWVGALAPGGWLAIQVPGNFAAPSHRLLRSVAARYLPGLALRADPVLDPAGYWRLLTDAGCRVRAWETTYLHVLAGEDAVLEWTRGTALRPVLAAFGDRPQAQEFLAEYAAALRLAYPPEPGGTVLPFRRVFAVAQRL